MDTRLKALKNDSLDPVDYQLIFIKFLVKFFPDVPDRLLQRLVPGCPTVVEGEKKFMNRKQRKAVQKAEKVAVNLFSGAQKWRLSDSEHVVSVEKEKGQDLHSDEVWKPLLDLAFQGRIHALTAGPPCRTFSRLRGARTSSSTRPR